LGRLDRNVQPLKMTVGVGGRDSTRRRNAHPYGHFELGFRFTDMGFYDTIILTITNGEFIMVTYELYGKYGTDNLESLLVSKVNGDPIWTISQTESIINYWKEKARDGMLLEVKDWRIKKVNA
jgi:hypothetical protein